jgi:hypothetical protein
MAPLKPSRVTARSSSSAAAFGSGVGIAAKAANRSGWARQAHRDLGLHLLQPRVGVRQHLQVDAGLVHFLEAQFADVVEPLDQPRRVLRVDAGKVPLYLGIEVMLLQRDDVGLGCHLSPPLTQDRPRFLTGEGEPVIGRSNPLFAEEPAARTPT